MNQEVGMRIQKLVRRSGMRVKDFAEKLSVTPETASRIINGKYNVSPVLAQRIADLFFTSPEYILNGENRGIMGDDDIDVNLINSRLKLMQRLLASYGFHFTEVVEINDKKYTRSDETEYINIEKKGNIYKYTEESLSSMISPANKVRHYVILENFEDILTIEYTEYVRMVTSIADNICNSFLHLNKKIPFCNEIDNAIHDNKIEEEYYNV